MTLFGMTNKMNITFHSKDNTKTSELNQILDKISINKELSDREKDFLEKYDSINDDELKDYNYLTLLDLFYLIIKLDKTIICDIKDKDGRINQEILSIDYDNDDCAMTLGLKHGIYKMTDNYLYKMIYVFKHDNYSLDIESEYHEKINLEK
jgi:hypothetical protein